MRGPFVRSSDRPHDVFDFLKSLQAPRPEFAPQTALLVAAPGGLRKNHLRRIDPYQPGLQRVGDLLGGGGVATDDTGHQPVFTVVGQGMA